jgi:hypothetical protein
MQPSKAVAAALAHIDAWCSHDWEKTRLGLSPTVHAWVTNTQPDFARTVEITGIDDYMPRKMKSAQLIEPGSLEVISAFGDEQHAMVLVTFRIALGPNGAMMTMARSCLYAIDDEGKIQEERDQFLVM